MVAICLISKKYHLVFHCAKLKISCVDCFRREMKRKRRRLQKRKIPKRAKIWGGDQPEPGNTSATGGCGLTRVKCTGQNTLGQMYAHLRMQCYQRHGQPAESARCDTSVYVLFTKPAVHRVIGAFLRPLCRKLCASFYHGSATKSVKTAKTKI